MPFEKENKSKEQEEMVKTAMEKVGLAYEPRPNPDGNSPQADKSPSDVALDRFRAEYGKRVRAASGE